MSKELNELITELGKIVDGNQSIVSELDKLKSLYEKLKLEVAEKLEYPFDEREDFWAIDSFGDARSSTWTNHSFNTSRYSQGNVFKTKEEAERERDKRALLTRFRQFRDKCNGEWKPEFDDFLQDKYTIRCDYGLKELFLFGECRVYEFSLFGYFKNGDDCKRAIELFGDEIKRLWVEE
nr:MAG TPA: hypothetical protein [Bacteriophage sp.]